MGKSWHRHLTDLKDIRQHLAEALYHAGFDNGYLDEDERTWLDNFPRLAAVWSVFTMRFLATVCEVRGHDYQNDGGDYPDSGGEGFTCQRCGHSFTAWH